MADRISRARELRRNQTEAEKRLWARLRGRRLAGFKFVRQLPIAGYFADFACHSATLVIELDGGQHGVRTAEDTERTKAIESAGWQVIRFWNDETLANTDGVAEHILEMLELARGR